MRRRLDSLAQLTLWTLRDFAREPWTIFWSVGFPMVMTLVLGQITGHGGPLRADVAVLTTGPAQEARARAWIRTAPERGTIRWRTLPEAGLARALAVGSVRLGVERPWDPSRRLWRLDPSDTHALLAYYELRDALDGRPRDISPAARTGGRYIDFLMPGLLAMGVVNACLWGVGLTLVELREKRLLRLMLATPLDPEAIFGALFLSRLLLALGEAVALLAFSRWLFHIRVLGSYGALAALWVCGTAAFFGLAVLLGSRTDRAHVGEGLVNAVTLPVFLVSGVFFALDNFPPGLRAVCRAFPPTLLVSATRTVMSAGGGWGDVALPCAALLAMGGACYALGRAIFRYT